MANNTKLITDNEKEKGKIMGKHAERIMVKNGVRIITKNG